MILGFFARYALLVDQNKSFIGKNEEVAHDPKRAQEPFPFCQSSI